MGFTLPSNTNSTSPMDHARQLMEVKANIEAELDAHFSILKANDVTMQTPLVDPEGFPRADIDIFAVRPARVRIIELRNDLKAVMDEIAKALEVVYDPSATASQNKSDPKSGESKASAPEPFAKVDGVAPGSPASEAGLQRADLVVKFGSLTRESFPLSSLQPLAELVAANENRAIAIRIIRSGETKIMTLTPRKGWGGRGLLGCHIVPYSVSDS